MIRKDPRTRRLVKISLSVSAFALVLAACGGQDETAPESASDSEQPEAEAPATEEPVDAEEEPVDAEEDRAAVEQPELDEVTIMLGGHAMSWAPAYVAQELGYFEEEGVSVEIVASPEGAPAAIAAVVSDSVFLTFSGGAGQIAAITEGAPVKWTFVSALGLAPEICATPDWLEENGLDESSPLEDKLAALPGSRMAIFNPGDNLEQLYRFLWAHFDLGNIDTDGTELLNLSNLSGVIAAASQGAVDVMSSTPPGCQQAESQGIAEIFLQPMNEVNELAIMPASTALANDRSIEQFPNTHKAIIRALERANELVRTDPDTVVPILREQFSETDEEDFLATFEQHVSVRAPERLAISEDQWESFKLFRELQGSGVGDVTYTDAINVELADQARAQLEN